MSLAGRLNDIADLLQMSLSHDAAVRQVADKKLFNFIFSPDYALGLLTLVASESPRYENIRPTASVHFKNLLRLRWPKADADHPLLPDFERDVIKETILDLLLTTPPPIQIHISEALSVAAFDFPSDWSSILPSIVSLLDLALVQQDVSRINSLLLAAASLFLRFRDAGKQIQLDLNYSIDAFAYTWINAVDFVTKRLNENQPECHPVFECFTLCCKIFCSLGALGVHARLKPQLTIWIKFLHYSINFQYPAALEDDGGLNLLRGAICDNIELFVKNQEEEFMPFLPSFCTTVCRLLTVTGQNASPSRAQFSMDAIKFLTTVAAVSHHLFTEDGLITKVYDHIIVPNLCVEEEHKELFDTKWSDYVSLGSEGNSNTLRCAVFELLLVLATNHNDKVVELVSKHIKKMLPPFNADQLNNWDWENKDAVIYLVIALKQGSHATAVAIPEALMHQFFQYMILPELQASDWQSEPMLKATVLRFLIEFCDQIPKDSVFKLLPSVLIFLNHQSSVVHSYAAIFIDNTWAMASAPRVNQASAAELNSFVPQIIQNLSTGPNLTYSYKNPYLIKCLMVVLGIGSIADDQLVYITSKLVGVVEEMCNNPEISEFSQYVLEALSIVIARYGGSAPLPCAMKLLERILMEDILDFVPFAYTAFTWLLSSSKLLMNDGILDKLLQSASWHESFCVSFGVSFLRQILSKHQTEGFLDLILEKWYPLAMQMSGHEAAFWIMATLMDFFGSDVMERYMENIWSSLFSELGKVLHTRFEEKFSKYLHDLIRYSEKRYGSAFFEKSIKFCNEVETVIQFKRRFL